MNGVIREAVIAACLTAMMILLFLGSWRSTLIIAISIPLSILTFDLRFQRARGNDQHHDAGGLALAVGILVDDATVTIENIDRNFDEGKDFSPASWTARPRSLCPRWSPLSASALCFCPCSSSPASPISLRSARRSRRVRHAGVVYPFAYFGSDAGHVPAEARSAPCAPSRHRWNLAGRFQSAFERGFEAPRRHITAARNLHPPPRSVRSCVLFLAAAFRSLSPGSGAIFSPSPIPASSVCMFAPKPGPGSRRPPGFAT